MEKLVVKNNEIIEIDNNFKELFIENLLKKEGLNNIMKVLQNHTTSENVTDFYIEVDKGFINVNSNKKDFTAIKAFKKFYELANDSKIIDNILDIYNKIKKEDEKENVFYLSTDLKKLEANIDITDIKNFDKLLSIVSQASEIIPKEERLLPLVREVISKLMNNKGKNIEDIIGGSKILETKKSELMLLYFVMQKKELSNLLGMYYAYGPKIFAILKKNIKTQKDYSYFVNNILRHNIKVMYVSTEEGEKVAYIDVDKDSETIEKLQEELEKKLKEHKGIIINSVQVLPFLRIVNNYIFFTNNNMQKQFYNFKKKWNI